MPEIIYEDNHLIIAVKPPNQLTQGDETGDLALLDELKGYIKVKYQNEKMQVRMKTYTGWTAQIIQHEVDHCNGIII